MAISPIDNGEPGSTIRSALNEVIAYVNAVSGSGSNSIDTSSFATTGSNIFVGNQTISGSIIFENNGLIESIPTSSGDGLNASTLVLKPDISLLTDQYIVLDPTSPNHIHIRAGGAIDNSTAYLYLGGETNYVQVNDGGYITLLANNDINLNVNNTIYLTGKVVQGSSTATGTYSHAEGNSTQAIGESSHAEGRQTQAVGDHSHAEGSGAITSGSYSHAEGENTQAIGYASHAEGIGTIASGSYQHVSGQFNTHGDDTSLFIIGNGTDTNNRSDILRVTTTDVQVTGSTYITGSLSVTGGIYGYTPVNGASIISDFSLDTITPGEFRKLDSSAGKITITVPTGSVAGTEYSFWAKDLSSAIDFLAGSGLTLHSEGGKLKINAQFSVVTVKYLDSSTAILIGSLKA